MIRTTTQYRQFQPEGRVTMVSMKQQGFSALVTATLVSFVVLILADRIRRLLGDSVVSAIEKLMGLVLTAIAVVMVLAGLKRYFVGGP